MKKTLTRIVAFLLLSSCATFVWFSCAACSSKTEKDVTMAREEVLRRALDNTFALEKAIIGISGTEGTDGAFDVKLSAVRNAGDYDYKYERKAGDSYVLHSAKIGDSVYKRADGSENNVFTVIKANNAGLPALGEIKNFVKEFAAGETSGDVTSRDGVFEFEFERSFGEELREIVDLIAGGKGIQAGEYIASVIGDNYTRAELVSDVKEIFADNVTVGAMMRGIDAMLNHAGSDMTAARLVNGLADFAGITTARIYYMSGKLRAPKEDETVYDYLLFGSGLAIIPADTLMSRLDKVSPELGQFSQMRTRDMREKILELIDSDDMTFEDLYDDYLATYVRAALADYLPGGISLDFATVEKLRVGKTSIELSLTVDSSKFLPLASNITVSVDYGGVDLSAPDIIITGMDITAVIGFDYDSSVNITLPAGSIIE